MKKTKATKAKTPKRSPSRAPVPVAAPQETPQLAAVRLDFKFKNRIQKEFADLIARMDVTICAGSPGTGKTIVACYEALRLMKSDPRYKRIVLVKSVTTLAGEEVGFLKGGLDEKLAPYEYAFISNFKKIADPVTVDKMRAEGLIEMVPLAYLRGATLDGCIIICDEAQNISWANMRTLMTRIGDDSKLVILGDVEQVDMRDRRQSALGRLLRAFAPVDEVGVMTIGDEFIVRHPLIMRIEQVFKGEGA